MAPKLATLVPLASILVLLLIGFASSDVNQDKAECANQVVALASCLPYVGGDAKAPTADCCSGLKQLLQKSQKCLCLLIKDKDDPSLGLKINTTLAATLPSACHSPANVSDCISLLHLAPNSADAKIFQEFANMTQGIATAPAASGNSTSGSSSASEKRWPKIELAFRILVINFFTLYI
ncbi:non-specific lipid transfer protein GPI-anchored 6-like [Mangifera indica]|uniref:non-specific lipid transfer protein GPI-anchored 6-like n=1 Tax=Mangifera indica TaxID=29780 RepID=UPI001CFA2BFF|nr:non-specific lipid transfer protein GPI-anchored 6-like [Mangifera indica]